MRVKAGGVLFFGGKENDLEEGVRSNMYPTSWPSDSKVVREEAIISLEALGEAMSSGGARSHLSEEMKNTSRREAEEKGFFDV